MSHALALALLALDCAVRAWRIQLAIWTAGGRLGFRDALRLNLYGEAASTLTPNRLGGEPARFLGLNEARVRPVTSLVAIGVEVAAEWPVFMLVGAALVAYYVPDWQTAARHWLRRHRASATACGGSGAWPWPTCVARRGGCSAPARSSPSSASPPAP